MEHHDCSKVLSKVFLVLDGELTTDEEQEFLKEIKDCNCCLEKYQIEKSFKSFLCNKINREQISSQTITSIRQKIDEYRIHGTPGM